MYISYQLFYVLINVIYYDNTYAINKLFIKSNKLQKTN